MHRVVVAGVVSAILFRERTGITWRDLPERFGPCKMVYQRKRRWAIDGYLDTGLRRAAHRLRRR